MDAFLKPTSTPPVVLFCTLTLSLAVLSGRDVNIPGFSQQNDHLKRYFVTIKDVKRLGFHDCREAVECDFVVCF